MVAGARQRDRELPGVQQRSVSGANELPHLPRELPRGAVDRLDALELSGEILLVPAVREVRGEAAVPCCHDLYKPRLLLRGPSSEALRHVLEAHRGALVERELLTCVAHALHELQRVSDVPVLPLACECLIQGEVLLSSRLAGEPDVEGLVDALLLQHRVDEVGLGRGAKEDVPHRAGGVEVEEVS